MWLVCPSAPMKRGGGYSLVCSPLETSLLPASRDQLSPAHWNILNKLKAYVYPCKKSFSCACPNTKETSSVPLVLTWSEARKVKGDKSSQSWSHVFFNTTLCHGEKDMWLLKSQQKIKNNEGVQASCYCLMLSDLCKFTTSFFHILSEKD